MDGTLLTGGGRNEVLKQDGVVIRQTGPWALAVHALLRHLETVGFQGSPRVVGTGFDQQGREVLTYIDGDVCHHKPWTDEGVVAVGKLLRNLHDSTDNFIPPVGAEWRKSIYRDLRVSRTVYGHGDFAPWNLVSKEGIPFAAIDWETAGPMDAVVELAQVCWLNVQLCDDDVAERVGLGSLEVRSKQLRLLVDAYGLSRSEREKLVEVMIHVAVLDAAEQAIEAKVTPDSQGLEPLWAIAWRTRSAAWIIRNQECLEKALI